MQCKQHKYPTHHLVSWTWTQNISQPRAKDLPLRSLFLFSLKMCRGEEEEEQQQPLVPCLHCQPQECIRMVQHLIERCLILRMSRDECATALSKHACIHPTVTLTVWEGLLKENRDFFRTYSRIISTDQIIN
ncbi:unnamed protein product [Linum tenue]|uniref:Uncharacterized protein n=1 Tax=Linum tenue TaxID=586396 RepID=A0AAV0NCU7_9ROSI|nr:unnamed protein product [Linum tenue]